MLTALTVGVNRRTFARIVRRQTGILDPRMLPNTPRRISFVLCSIGTIALYFAIGLFFASKRGTLQVLVMSIMSYVAAGVVLSRGVWGLRGAFLPQGRIAEILRRTWQVIRNELP